MDTRNPQVPVHILVVIESGYPVNLVVQMYVTPQTVAKQNVIVWGLTPHMIHSLNILHP